MAIEHNDAKPRPQPIPSSPRTSGLSAGSDQTEFWNGPAATKWVAHREQTDRMIGDFGEAALERASIAEADRVVDVGCGCGTTTLAIAQRVGPSGHVTGLDLSAPMLAHARQRATEVGNTTFVQADAADHELAEASCDLLFSRFGVMFFTHPEDAFTNLARWLKPGGRVSMVVWRRVDENPWVMVPLTAVLPWVGKVDRPGPEDPGPFSFGDPQRVRRIFAAAGFRDVELTPFDRDVDVGTTDPAGVADFAMEMGPASRLLADVDADTRSRAREAILRAVEAIAEGGQARLAGAAWVINARR